MSTFAKPVTFISMSAIDELLEEIEEKEERIKESIRNSELRLGIEAVSEHEVLGLRVGVKLLEASLAASSKLDDAEAAFDDSKSFLAAYRAKEEKLESILKTAPIAEVVSPSAISLENESRSLTYPVTS